LSQARRAGFEALAERYGLTYCEDGSRAVRPPADFAAEIVGGLVVNFRFGHALVGDSKEFVRLLREGDAGGGYAGK